MRAGRTDEKQEVLREAEELLSLLAMFHLPGGPPLPQIGEVGKLRSVEEVKELVLQGFHTLREEAMRHPLPESTRMSGSCCRPFNILRRALPSRSPCRRWRTKWP